MKIKALVAKFKSRPRPVITAASIASGVTAVASIIGIFGFVGPAAKLSGEADTIGTLSFVVFTTAVHLWAAVHVQKKITPLADPRNEAGVALAPVAAPVSETVPALEPASVVTPPTT